MSADGTRRWASRTNLVEAVEDDQDEETADGPGMADEPGLLRSGGAAYDYHRELASAPRHLSRSPSSGQQEAAPLVLRAARRTLYLILAGVDLDVTLTSIASIPSPVPASSPSTSSAPQPSWTWLAPRTRYELIRSFEPVPDHN